MLSSIRRALQREGKPEQAGTFRAPPAAGQLQDLALAITTKCRENRSALIEQFESELTKVRGLFYRASSDAEAIDYIVGVTSATRSSFIVGWSSGVIAGLKASELEARGITFLTESAGDEFTSIAATTEIGVSGVDYALADTGTLVVLARKGRARSISLLPPVHIAVVRPEQIISGLDDLPTLLRYESAVAGDDLSSAITLITGPSRTADIELTLVVGVHGPQQLHVVLLDS